MSFLRVPPSTGQRLQRDERFPSPGAFLASAGYAILASRVLPAVGRMGRLGPGRGQLAAVPAIDQGNGFLEKVIAGGSAAGGLYSSIRSIAGPAYITWLLASGIAL